MKVSHRQLDVGDARIHYLDCNPEGGSRHPPAVMLPGGPGESAALMRRLTRRLRLDRLGLRQVFVDHRCVGRSTGDLSTFRLARLAADVDAVREDLGVDRVGVTGASFGGFAALTYAATYPERVAFLVAVDTAAAGATARVSAADYLAGHGSASQQAAWRRRVDVVEGRRPPDSLEDWVDWATLQPLYAVRHPARAALVLGGIACRLPGRWPRLYPAFRRIGRLVGLRQDVEEEWMQAEDRDYDVRDDLGRVAAPTLVLCGAEDWICPVPESRVITDRIPGAELVIVPRAGHAVMTEAPGEVAAAIADFLDRRVPPV